MLKAGNLNYEIDVVEVQGYWRPTIHLRAYSAGQARHYWRTSLIPGKFSSEAAAFRVAHLFVVTNVSGDRAELCALNWIYRQPGMVSD